MQYQTDDPEIKAIRRCWQNGLTLSQAARRLRLRHGPASDSLPTASRDRKNFFVFESNEKLITEWRKMKRLFRNGSLPQSYLLGRNPSPPRVPTQQELDTPVGDMAGGQTYGDWAGITGPGKILRELLQSEKA
jgi:hypothetical protein